MEEFKTKLISLQKITKLPTEIAEIIVINSLSYKELKHLLKIKKYERLVKDGICMNINNESFEFIVKNFPEFVKELNISYDGEPYLKVLNCNKKIIATNPRKSKKTKQEYNWNLIENKTINLKKFYGLEKISLTDMVITSCDDCFKYLGDFNEIEIDFSFSDLTKPSSLLWAKDQVSFLNTTHRITKIDGSKITLKNKLKEIIV
jgi:hypothetical protein